MFRAFIIFDDNLIISQKDYTAATPEREYLLGEAHNNTRLLTDANGAIAATYEYDAYGELRSGSSTGGTRYLYNGQQFDSESGLYSLRARHYDPSLGRFLTQDPYTGNYMHEFNRYVYAMANPVMFSDPSGLSGLGSYGKITDIMGKLSGKTATTVGRLAGTGLQFFAGMLLSAASDDRLIGFTFTDSDIFWGGVYAILFGFDDDIRIGGIIGALTYISATLAYNKLNGRPAGSGITDKKGLATIGMSMVTGAISNVLLSGAFSLIQNHITSEISQAIVAAWGLAHLGALFAGITHYLTDDDPFGEKQEVFNVLWGLANALMAADIFYKYPIGSILVANLTAFAVLHGYYLDRS